MSDVEQAAPTDELMQSVEHLFASGDPAGRRKAPRNPHAWRPPTDLCETDEAIIAHIEIAGMKGESLSVSIADKVLYVTGIRQRSGPGGAYHRMEIRYGEFHTQIHLPATIHEEQVEASYSDGFLTVVMPKRGAHRVRVITSPGREDQSR